MSDDASIARRLLDFELALDASVAEQTFEAEWGRAFLSPGLPLVYDASFITIEKPGMGIEDVVAVADDVLGGAGFNYRTVVAWRSSSRCCRAHPVTARPCAQLTSAGRLRRRPARRRGNP